MSPVADVTPTPASATALALLAGRWATPDRIARVLRTIAAGGDLLPHDATTVLDALTAGAARAGAAASDARVEAVRSRLAAHGAAVRVVTEPGYPTALEAAWPEKGAPLWLAIRRHGGRLPEGPAVSVVGTREPTLDGLRTATELGKLLGRHGVVVVSGLARGIDQAAHRGALSVGGETVAVLGAGFDVDYPRGTTALREEIADSGGLVAELAPDAAPRPVHFLERNRIVSGLSAATVIVEGRARSGALATASRALDQGRDVLAVPGSLWSMASQAPLALVRDGAQLVTRLDDVLEAVLPGHGAVAAPGALPPPPGIGADARTVLQLLGSTPAAPDVLARSTGRDVRTVLRAAAELTARGLAAQTPLGLVRRR
jgi:DNA processing protein